jgi:hypothetical protein
VRAQSWVLQVDEVVKSRGAETSIGSRSMGGPLDQSPIALFRVLEGSEVERTSLSTSKVVKCQDLRHDVDTWQSHKVGPT